MSRIVQCLCCASVVAGSHGNVSGYNGDRAAVSGEQLCMISQAGEQQESVMVEEKDFQHDQSKSKEVKSQKMLIMMDSGSSVDVSPFCFREKFAQYRQGKAPARSLAVADGNQLERSGNMRWLLFELEGGKRIRVDMELLDIVRPIFSTDRRWTQSGQGTHFPTAEDPTACFQVDGVKHALVRRNGQYYLPVQLIGYEKKEKQRAVPMPMFLWQVFRSDLLDGVFWSGVVQSRACFLMGS